MQQSSPVRDHVTIGILGTLTSSFFLILCLEYLCLYVLVPALQGAFAEHQVMLQKLSLKRRVVIVLGEVREGSSVLVLGGRSQSVTRQVVL